jgi:alkyl hydroperoxide reductase subunit AhpF
MAAVKVFSRRYYIVPVLRIEWIDNTVHHAAMGIMLAAERKKLSLVGVYEEGSCVSMEY